MRGVGAGRSAQRGTSGATTGPRGARSTPKRGSPRGVGSAPPNPEASTYLCPNTILITVRAWLEGDLAAVLRVPAYRRYVVSRVAAGVGQSMLQAIIAWQVY